MKTNKAMYEEQLNEKGKFFEKEKFVIAGKFREYYYPNQYGKALRLYDYTSYIVGWHKWYWLWKR